MLTPRMRRKIRREMSVGKPIVRIGKHGPSKETLSELDRQLERAEVVKVRILKTALGEEVTKAIAEESAQSTRSNIVEVRGHTFVLYRKKERALKIRDGRR